MYNLQQEPNKWLNLFLLSIQEQNPQKMMYKWCAYGNNEANNSVQLLQSSGEISLKILVLTDSLALHSHGLSCLRLCLVFKKGFQNKHAPRMSSYRVST